jgi:hypothetical protein
MKWLLLGLAAGLGLVAGTGMGRAVTFEQEVDLAESATASTLNEISPQAVAVDGEGRVVIVWSEFPAEGGAPELMARMRLTDGSWSESKLLTERDGKYSGDAALAGTAEGQVAIAWVDQGSGSFEVRAGRLDLDKLALAGTESLCEPMLLVMEPAIAAGPEGEVAVAWTAMVDMNYELRLRRRAPGQAFAPIEAVTPEDRRASDQISLAYGPGGRLHLAWADNRSGARRILYGSLGPGGRGEPPVEVSPVEGASKQTRPRVTVGPDGRVAIAWMDSRSGGDEVLVAATGGSGFQAPTRAGKAGVASRSPCLVGAPSGLHLLWEDSRFTEGESASVQILYARVSPKGLSEETPVTTDLPVSCFNPCLAAGRGGALHLVWRNAGFGEGDIFYREGMASGPWSPQ